MKIELNKVTWYSKLLAVILFLFILPGLTFYIGRQYEQAFGIQALTLNLQQPPVQFVDHTKVSQDEYLGLRQALIKRTVDFNLITRPYQHGLSLVSPQMSNKFFYTDSDTQGLRIGYYDFDADKGADLQEPTTLRILPNTTWVYDKKVFQDNGRDEFRMIGFDGDKLVFYQTSSDDSPGPCYDAWLRTGILYISITDSKATPKPYTLTVEQKKAHETEEVQCIKNNR